MLENCAQTILFLIYLGNYFGGAKMRVWLQACALSILYLAFCSKHMVTIVVGIPVDSSPWTHTWPHI